MELLQKYASDALQAAETNVKDLLGVTDWYPVICVCYVHLRSCASSFHPNKHFHKAQVHLETLENGQVISILCSSVELDCYDSVVNLPAGSENVEYCHVYGYSNAA